jgi:hypothetical protein
MKRDNECGWICLVRGASSPSTERLANLLRRRLVLRVQAEHIRSIPAEETMRLLNDLYSALWLIRGEGMRHVRSLPRKVLFPSPPFGPCPAPDAARGTALFVSPSGNASKTLLNQSLSGMARRSACLPQRSVGPRGAATRARRMLSAEGACCHAIRREERSRRTTSPPLWLLATVRSRPASEPAPPLVALLQGHPTDLAAAIHPGGELTRRELISGTSCDKLCSCPQFCLCY